MKKKFRPLIQALIIIAVALGIIFWKNQNTQNTSSTPLQPSAKSEDLFPITLIPFVNDKHDNIRYSCKNKTLVPELAKDENYPGGFPPTRHATSIKIMPDNVTLEKIDSTAEYASYTFDRECKNVYSIVRYQQDKGAADIFAFDARNGNYRKLTENLLPRFRSNEEMVNASPASPIFIHAINSQKLLISFFGFTTGLDAYTNFTIHKIFNVEEKKFSNEIAFADETSQQWLLSPTILNFRSNILSNAVALDRKSDGGYTKFIRKDYDLDSEKFLSTAVLDANLLNADILSEALFFACPSKSETPVEYEKCLQANTENIFPKSPE